jgi:Fe-S-cluster containining protein
LNFENVIFPDSVGFRCRKCGLCCREQPADLSEKEHQQIEAKGFTGFSVKANGMEGPFIRRKKDRSCFFLTKDNECRIYEVRPVGCRIQPFTITDWDYERNMIEVDLPVDSKCKGILEGGPLPIEEIGRAAQTMLQNLLEIEAKFLGLPITDKRVASETRHLTWVPFTFWRSIFWQFCPLFYPHQP